MDEQIIMTKAEMVAAFTRWDAEYREHPEEFMSTVEHLMHTTPDEYGPAASACLVAYVEKIRSGQ